MICKKKYLELIDSRPDLFTNPPAKGLIKVLTSVKDIAEVEIFVKKQLSEIGYPESFGDIGVVYNDQYMYLLRDAVVFPNGNKGTYIRSISSNLGKRGVVIMPLYGDKIIFERHFRHATRKEELEFPRGFGDDGFTDIENAVRELREEIGAEISAIYPIGTMTENTGICNGLALLYVALVSSFGELEINEGISGLELYSIDAVREMINNDIIRDSFTLAALLKSGIIRI